MAEITTITIHAELVEHQVLWFQHDIDPSQYAVQIAESGNVPVQVDSYSQGVGPQRAVLMANEQDTVQVKGAGLTPYAGFNDHLGTITRTQACREAIFAAILNRKYTDAPRPLAVLTLNGIAPANCEYELDPQENFVKKENGNDHQGLLIRQFALRLEHLKYLPLTNTEKLQTLCTVHGIDPEDEELAARTLLERWLDRQFYWFYRRVDFGTRTLDDLDYFGNMVDFRDAEFKRDYSDTVAFGNPLSYWESVVDRCYDLVHFIGDHLVSTTRSQAFISYGYSIVKERMSQLALTVMGIPATDYARAFVERKPELLSLGKAIMTFIRLHDNQTHYSHHLDNVLSGKRIGDVPHLRAVKDAYDNIKADFTGYMADHKANLAALSFDMSPYNLTPSDEVSFKGHSNRELRDHIYKTIDLFNDTSGKDFLTHGGTD